MDKQLLEDIKSSINKFNNDIINFKFYREADLEWTLQNILYESINNDIYRIYNDFPVYMNKLWYINKTKHDKHKKNGGVDINNSYEKIGTCYFLKKELEPIEDKSNTDTLKIVDLAIVSVNDITEHIEKPIPEFIIEIKYEPSRKRMEKYELYMKTKRNDISSIRQDKKIIEILDSKEKICGVFLFYDEGRQFVDNIHYKEDFCENVQLNNLYIQYSKQE